MDLGEPGTRSLDSILEAYDPDQVFWLATLLGLEFILGVVLAFKNNEFDWGRVFDIGKKNIFYAAGWGVAWVYSVDLGNAVYGLVLVTVGASVVTNVTALMGTVIPGIPGQLLTKGPGDGGDTSSVKSAEAPTPVVPPSGDVAATIPPQ